MFIKKLCHFLKEIIEHLSNNNNIIILARAPKIAQGLGRILSCGARKPERT